VRHVSSLVLLAGILAEGSWNRLSWEDSGTSVTRLFTRASNAALLVNQSIGLRSNSREISARTLISRHVTAGCF